MSYHSNLLTHITGTSTGAGHLFVELKKRKISLTLCAGWIGGGKLEAGRPMRGLLLFR